MKDTRGPSRRGDQDGAAFRVEVLDGDGGPVLWAKGELDLTVTATLDDALGRVRAVPGQSLIVDASELTFLDVGGLRVLIQADQRLRAAGGAGLAVRGARGIVRRVFEVMRATSLLADRSSGAANILGS